MSLSNPPATIGSWSSRSGVTRESIADCHGYNDLELSAPWGIGRVNCQVEMALMVGRATNGKGVVILLLQQHPEKIVRSLSILHPGGQDCKLTLSLSAGCPAGRHSSQGPTVVPSTLFIVKLNDYRPRLAELEQSANPFARLVAAHLWTQDTQAVSTTKG